MSKIQVTNLTFTYDGSYDSIFENVSFSFDTDWKLGFIGRNGKGKTTFLNLLLGKYEYCGSISGSVNFDYFPYEIDNTWMVENTIDVIEKIKPNYELWMVCKELSLLEVDVEVLYRPFQTLSHGERTKVMLALLFSEDEFEANGTFHLIDEPTNHLDMPTRIVLQQYLNTKKGFLLVSHDRATLDACIDHVLVLNRESIQVEKGTFSSWWENKQKRDQFEIDENTKLKREIGKLEESARRTERWADRVEKSKIGYNPLKDTDRNIDSRAYIGEKSKRMQQRRKNLENHQEKAMDEKRSLLKDLEKNVNLKLNPLQHHKERYIYANNLSIGYGENAPMIEHVGFELKRGDRLILQGANGCGKSSLIKAILEMPGVKVLGADGIHTSRNNQPFHDKMWHGGNLEVAYGLNISYINQDTSFLRGKLQEHIIRMGLDESLFKAILRQLDFERVQFEKNMEDYSQGQKKKVLIAGSLLQPAHLFIWDEPLNYIDVFSRMQIEALLLEYQPTMIMVEHDATFAENIGNSIVNLSGKA